MPALSEYTNVYGTALAILKEKGYQLWRDANDLYWAEKDGWDFASRSPCGLLGLIAIYEHRKPTEFDEYWWRKDEIDQLKDVPTSPPHPYAPVIGTLRARRGNARRTRTRTRR